MITVARTGVAKKGQDSLVLYRPLILQSFAKVLKMLFDHNTNSPKGGDDDEMVVARIMVTMVAGSSEKGGALSR